MHIFDEDIQTANNILASFQAVWDQRQGMTTSHTKAILLAHLSMHRLGVVSGMSQAALEAFMGNPTPELHTLAKALGGLTTALIES